MRRIHIRPPASQGGFVAGISATLYGLAVELSMLTEPPPNSRYPELIASYAWEQEGLRIMQVVDAFGLVFLLVFVYALGARVLHTKRGSYSLAMAVGLSGVAAAATSLAGLAGFIVAGLLVFRSLAFIGAPAVPFPPLYPVWFEVVGVSLAIGARW